MFKQKRKNFFKQESNQQVDKQYLNRFINDTVNVRSFMRSIANSIFPSYVRQINVEFWSTKFNENKAMSDKEIQWIILRTELVLINN